MRLVVGLGNPGKRYEGTWHNLGVSVTRELAKRWGAAFKKGRGDYQIAEPGSSHPALMIPTSFMNRSGEPVSGWMRYHRVPPEEILIVLDDHDLPLGRIRLRQEGSSGGHKGLGDIIVKLGSNQVPRLRLGIRAGREAEELADQVLSSIPRGLRKDVRLVVQTAADAVELALLKGTAAAMNKYNKWTLYPDVLSERVSE